MKTFNLIIAGVGGQGVITLVSILDEASLLQGYDVKSSELHGLSQRGGSVVTHVRFGEKVFSPMVSVGKADLIIGLEQMEALRHIDFCNKDTNFLINKYSMGFEGHLSEEEVLQRLQDVAGDNLHLIPASKICKESLDKEVLGGIYLIGYAVLNKLIPLKPEFVLKAIEKAIPEKYQEMNIKAFNLARTK